MVVTSIVAGALKLNVGLVDATKGADKLSKKLGDGADKTNQIKDNKKTFDMFGTPIKLHASDNTNTKTNGYGMAPYMLSVYLYVGMITLIAVLDIFTPAIVPPKNGFSWWISKMMMPLLLSIGAAFVVWLSSIFLIGIHPTEPGKMLFILILASITDMAILFLLTAVLGKFGTFIALILMVLQLAASGGTYPMELTTPFYRAIHPFMPMTYSIEGLRATISTGNSIVQPAIVLISITLVLFGLTWLFFESQMKKRFSFKHTEN